MQAGKCATIAATTTRPRVLVIGCGFGGIEAVRALSKAEVEITLVDRTNHHLFQPLLYQVATAGLSAPAVSAPIRHVLRREMKRGNLTILKAEVRASTPRPRIASLDGGDAIGLGPPHRRRRLDAQLLRPRRLGAGAPGLKTLADAFAIRARIVGAYESAERAGDDASRAVDDLRRHRRRPTGVEMAGTMSEIAQHTFRASSAASIRRARASSCSKAPTACSALRAEAVAARPRAARAARRRRAHRIEVTGIDAEGVSYETEHAA